MLQIFNYNAGKGDCIRLRYTGIQLRVERTYGALTKI